MKKFLATLMLSLAALAAMAGVLGAAPAAHAYTGSQDHQYVTMVEAAGITNTYGASGLIYTGQGIANDIGIRGIDPLTERNILLSINPGLGITDANIMVNDACLVYLGFNSATGVSPIIVY